MAFNLTDNRKQEFDMISNVVKKGKEWRKEIDNIGRRLKVVISQAHKLHEVIVVDGHSTDRTVEK